MHTELKLRNRKIADIKYALSKDDKLIYVAFSFQLQGLILNGFFLKLNNSTHPEYKKEAYLNGGIVSSLSIKKLKKMIWFRPLQSKRTFRYIAINI